VTGRARARESRLPTRDASDLRPRRCLVAADRLRPLSGEGL